MRPPSSNLHELIQSLTKEEKKRVTIYLKGLGKKGTEHLKLLRAIEKQEVYNEASLKKIFRANLFSQLKKRLYDLIMGTLVRLYHKKDIYHELLTGFQYFRVLKDRGLYTQAKEEIVRLKNLALKYEFFHYVVFINQELLALEDSVFIYKSYDNVSSKELFEECESHFERYINLMEYSFLVSKVICYTRKNVENEEELIVIDELSKKALLEDVAYARSALAKLYFYIIHINLSYLKNDKEKTYNNTLQSIIILEKFFGDIISPRMYMFSFYNLIFTAIRNNIKEDTITGFFEKKERNNLRLDQGNKEHADRLTFDLKLYWYAHVGNMEEGNMLVEAAKLSNKKLINTTCFNCAKICFLDEKYDEALKFLELAEKNTTKGDKLKDIYHIFKLLIYFESENFSLFDSLQRSLYRKYYSNKEKYKLALIVINSVGKLSRLTLEKEKAHLEKLYKVLLEVKDRAIYEEDLILNYAYIFQWVKSKIQGKTLINILKEESYI